MVRNSAAVDSDAQVDATVERVLLELRAAGHRITMPRRAVIDTLARVDDHPTVDQIANDIEARWPGIHLTTVYRTLETLTDLGVVNHVHLASGAAYHLAGTAGGGSQHVHAQCRTCHRVIDLPVGVLDAVRRRLDRTNGFHLEAHHVALSGLCADCARNATAGN